jgi:hypothetical protein
MNTSFRVCADPLSIKPVNRAPVVIAFRTLVRFDLDRGSTLAALGDGGAV